MADSQAYKLHLIGNSLYNKGDFEGAVASYTKALDLNPKLHETRFNRALAQMRLLRYDQALIDLSIRAESEEGLGDTYYLMGLVYRYMDDVVQAAHYYMKSLDIDPFDDRSTKELVLVVENMAIRDVHPDELLSIIAWMEMSPNTMVVIQSYISRSTIAGNKFDINEAEQLLQQALEIDPKSIVVIERLARLHYKFSDYIQAAECYQLILEIEPNNTSALCRLGEISLDKIDYDQAEKYYLTAIKYQPDSGEAFEGLANLYLSMGDHESAKMNFQFALKHDNNRPVSMYEWANLERNDNPELAIYLLKRILELHPEYSEAGEELDTLRSMFGDVDEDFGYLFLDYGKMGSENDDLK